MDKRIKEFALQAGINSPDGFKLTVNHMATFRLEKFANLVAAQEREACAKMCIQMANRCDDIRKAALETAAENIMARGTT